MPHAKKTQSRTQLVLQVFCFATFTFGSAIAHAEMHQCSGPDGRKTFSDQPCPERDATNNTTNKDAAIKAAQKAAAAAREAVVGMGNEIKSNAIKSNGTKSNGTKSNGTKSNTMKSNAMKSKPTSEAITMPTAMPTRQPARPPTTKADVAPTTTQDLEEQAIEQAAFSASLSVHVI